MTQQDIQAQPLGRLALAAQERDTIRRALSDVVGPKRAKQILEGHADTVVPALTDPALTRALEAVSAIVDSAEKEHDKIRPRRDEITLSLALYDNFRGLSTRLGLSRQRVHEMKSDALQLTEAERTPGPSCSKAKINRRNCGCEGHWLNNHTAEEIAERAERFGIKRVATNFALRHLDELSEQALRAEERRKVALEIRDALIQATDPAAWPRDRLAAIIKKNPSQISRIRGRGSISTETVLA